MRKRRVLRKRAGFTLLEMVAVLAILTILMGTVIMLLEPSFRIFIQSSNLSHTRLIADNVVELVANELSFATEISFDSEWEDAEVSGYRHAVYRSPSYGKMEFTQEDGIVILRQVADGTGGGDQSGEIAYGRDYYMGNTIQVGVSRVEDEVLRIDAAVFDRDGKLVGVTERYVRCLNGRPPS